MSSSRHSIENAFVTEPLRAFAEASAGAKRFHAEKLGAGVDPNYCFGDFLLAVKSGNRSRLEGVYKSALVETGGTTGGYLVPAELRYDIMQDVAKAAIFRPLATVVTMRSATLDLPVLDATTAQSDGTAPFWGGMKLQWTTQTETLPETEPKFRDLRLQANVLGGYLLTSNQLLQDADGLEAWLRQMFARSLAWYEDYAFIRGSGVGEPEGVLNAACAIDISRATSDKFSVADAQNMANVLYAVNNRGAWLLSISLGADLLAFTDWIPNGPMMLYGLPIFSTLKQPQRGTRGDAVLVDPSLYIIGDRQELLIDYSPYVKQPFLSYQTAWRVAERIDGRAMLNAAITVPDGSSNTVSPIVVLADKD